MEVILLERIERLGQMGDVVNVKNGYARNYLLPQKKALRKTKDNLAFFESKRKEYEARNLKMKQDAEALAEKMAGLSVVIVRQAAETGQLYGSVTMRDICEAIRDAGFHIERYQIDLNQPFKNLGIFDVKLSLHPDVAQTVRINIARSEEEAKRATQKKAKKEEKADAVKAEEKPVEEAKAE
ncbi:MAG: 50S ribosomal protein L9 [Alphaproteobacteria bacterium]|nr:50S ribosomal protein L9 [Alphaproteobacteria bacterium]